MMAAATTSARLAAAPKYCHLPFFAVLHGRPVLIEFYGEELANTSWKSLFFREM
jgi:hypothetical protein